MQIFKRNKKNDEKFHDEKEDEIDVYIAAEGTFSSQEKSELERFFNDEGIKYYFNFENHDLYSLHIKEENYDAAMEIIDAYFYVEEQEFIEKIEEKYDELEEFEKDFLDEKIKNSIQKNKNTEADFLNLIPDSTPKKEKLDNENELKKSKKEVENELKKLEFKPIKEKKQRKKLGRKNELKVRFTDEEIKKIHKKIEKSGLKQGEFIRRIILEKEVKILVVNPEDISELLELKAELGRVGGLLKYSIKPNENNHLITAEEMAEIKRALNDIENLKRKTEKVINKLWRS